MHFAANDISGQPLPNKRRTDDRYELLTKLQGVLKTLGYGGIVVLVDRVDEPHLINGKAEPMKALVWTLLDNKFLKHSGLGIKLLLPIELVGLPRERGPRLLPAGTARQTEHGPVARMDRRGTLRRGRRPASGRARQTAMASACGRSSTTR